MDARAAVCPRCGVGYELPRRPKPVLASVGTVGARVTAGLAVSVRVNDVVVHQCQLNVDPVTGRQAWRPARTVGADRPAR